MRRLLRAFGPGLITGAADDDPSGIATYSQVGAQFGYAMGWTVVLSLPFMAAVQELSARIGRATGQGLAATLRAHAPEPLVGCLVVLLVVANVINLGADIGAMGSALHLLVGGPERAYAPLIAVVCAGCEVWLAYRRYVTVLKWLTASLLAYVGLLFVVDLPWGEVLAGAFVPRLALDREAATALVAVLGTTISPYLFFWQAATEAENELLEADPRPLREHPADAPREMARIRLDTWTGMTYSNIVALAIMVGSAATLHAHGVTQIVTASDAASALAPIAGRYAAWVFALGIFGTGLLAVPVLAGSAAYAVGEALHWTVGLNRQALEARAFYGTLVAATLVGAGIVFSPITPIQALYWSAVINGVVAVPMIVAMTLMASLPSVMGALVAPRWLRAIGWIAAAIMGACTAVMVAI